MLFHLLIKLSNILFVFLLGIVTLWLSYMSMVSGRVRRSSPSKRAELFLGVKRNGYLYMRLPLRKSHYLIGRGLECEIPLRGMGIPIRVGEIYRQNERYVFRNLQDHPVMINNEPMERGSREILIGDEIMLYNYTITIHDAPCECKR